MSGFILDIMLVRVRVCTGMKNGSSIEMSSRVAPNSAIFNVRSIKSAVMCSKFVCKALRGVRVTHVIAGQSAYRLRTNILPMEYGTDKKQMTIALYYFGQLWQTKYHLTDIINLNLYICTLEIKNV